MKTPRRVRPAIVVAGCLLAAVAALTVVVWRQGDFWRASVANYVRERLAVEFGADFQTNELRGRWFPPRLSLGRVTLHLPGQTWVLTAEDVRISFNLYAVLFGRERLGRVIVDRPRLFVRERSRPGAEAGAAPAPAGDAATAAAAADAARRMRSFLHPPFPLRVLEISEGRVEVVHRDGGRSVASGVDLSVFVSSGSARAVLGVGELSLERLGRRLELGRIDAEGLLEEGRAVVRELSVARGPVTGTVGGTVEYAGAVALKGRLAAGLDQVAALAGHAGAATGRVVFDGEMGGTWRDPAAAGGIVVRDLSLKGRRWPEARARLTWGGARLAWSQLSLPLGDGAVSASGEVDFSAGGPRYRIEAEASGVDLSKLPGITGTAARVRRLGGTARWAGSGLGAAAAGGGRLGASFSLDTFPEEEIALEVDAALGSELLTVGAYRVSFRSLEAAGSGSWSRAAGFSGRVAGSVGDLRRLFPAAAVALGGQASFEGELGLAAGAPRYSGTLRLADGAIGPVRDIDGLARIVADAGTVRLVDATVSWPGVHGGATGTVDVPTGGLEIAAVVERFELREALRLMGADAAGAGGSLGGRLRLRGTLREPEIDGSLAGGDLSYGRTVLDETSLSLTYAQRRLGVTSLRVRRGSSRLDFQGEVREGGALTGVFKSPGFDLADFGAIPGLELAGTLQGRLSGPLRAPQLEGRLKAARLRYRGFDLKGGEVEIDYGAGKIGIEGWVAVPENRLRMVLEPTMDWRFESELALRQLAPEIVSSGAGALPPFVVRLLGRESLLAVGRLEARGRLRDPATIRAELILETLWLQAAGRSLQNRAPVRVSWREGRLAVESFSLAGEQYHLDVSGGGGPAAGWSLQADGAVDLELLRDFWPDLEEIVGTGELRLTLGGPWSAPLPEGSLVVHEAFVKARPLPEPLERLEGRLDLRGRTIIATALSGTIGDGVFRGRGSYDMASDRLDADVEGRLDLTFFRARLPAARELRGPLEVRLHLAGPIASPRLSGEIEVVDGELFARPFPAKFTHLRGRLTIGADRLEIRELSGQTGSGTVRLAGTLDWSRQPARVDAELEASGILLSLAGTLKAQNDLSLRLKGDLRDLHLSGEVRILKARYLREFGEKPPPLAVGGEPGADPAAADLSRMALDVKVRATDNVWIANRTAKIEAAVALDIGGTLGAPVVSGEITGIQGEAFYLSRQFRLESGSLRFAPPATVPRLDVQASTTVGETQILFLMEGPLNRPEYHLTSLPAMSQEDLFSLLTIGETRSVLERRGESAATAGAAVFTAVPLVSALGDEMRSSTGLETLQLEPIVGEGNQVSARITLGTHLSDRLFVSYSQNLGATEDQQVAVQYHLLDYLSLLGQELRQDVYSLDLVFRYTFK